VHLAAPGDQQAEHGEQHHDGGDGPVRNRLKMHRGFPQEGRKNQRGGQAAQCGFGASGSRCAGRPEKPQHGVKNSQGDADRGRQKLRFGESAQKEGTGETE
jgi:hypothetical protein